MAAFVRNSEHFRDCEDICSTHHCGTVFSMDKLLHGPDCQTGWVVQVYKGRYVCKWINAFPHLLDKFELKTSVCGDISALWEHFFSAGTFLLPVDISAQWRHFYFLWTFPQSGDISLLWGCYSTLGTFLLCEDVSASWGHFSSMGTFL